MFFYLYKSKSPTCTTTIFFQTEREIQSKTLTNTHSTRQRFFFFLLTRRASVYVNIRQREEKKKSLPAAPPDPVSAASVVFFFFPTFFFFFICCRRHRSIVEIHKMLWTTAGGSQTEKGEKKSKRIYITCISLDGD